METAHLSIPTRANKRGGARAGAGRKPILAGGALHKVSLDEATVAKMRELGAGDLSAGVRAAAARLATQSDAELRLNALEEVVARLPPWSPARESAVDPQDVQPNRWYARGDDELQLRALRDSCAALGGNAEPVVLRRTARGLEVVLGVRRWRACLEQSLPLNAVVREDLNDIELVKMMVATAVNWSSRDLGNTMREALDAGLFPSQRRMAESCHLPVEAAAHALRVAALPAAVHAILGRRELRPTHARALTEALARDPAGFQARVECLAGHTLAPAALLKALTDRVIGVRRPTKLGSRGL